MDERIKLLKLSLEKKNPSLLLGAGFSKGAINLDGEELPMGSDLAKKIYREMFHDNANIHEKEMIYDDKNDALEYSNNGDLRSLCTLLAVENRKKERNEIITKTFLGAHKEQVDFHSYLSEYKWSRIFTLNVDDFVEDIYEKNSCPLTIWRGENSDRRNNSNSTVLIKLHGCVRNSEAGYVFDEEEYVSFYNNTSYLLRDFGDAYVKGDVIFLGTEFQELDLKQIINSYEGSGYDTSTNDYFFVSPNINDSLLKRKIKEKGNWHWIEWSTKEFLDFLHKDINEKRELHEELVERGMVALDEYQWSSSIKYESKLYTGREPRLEDFFSEWDIVHPDLIKYVERLTNEKNPIVAAIVGNSYVGKTCFAWRVLFELRKRKYYSVKYDLNSSQDMHLFIEYLDTMPKETMVAVLFEDAAFFYPLLYQILMKKCPEKIKKLVIVTTETAHNYYVRKNILETNNAVIRFNLNLGIDRRYANNIYSKLNEKNWLNRPELHGSAASEIKDYAVETNDIVEFLYNITNGRGFEQHYEDLIKLENNSTNVKYLQMMSLLSLLGISRIPIRIFPNLLVENKVHFSMRHFKNIFDEILLTEDGYIKLRCQRLLQNVLLRDLNYEERKLIIIELIKQISGQFNEGDINELSEIFQKVLSVKVILLEHILDKEMLRDVMNEIEDYAKQYSYYWIQRGLVVQKEKDYDLADNYFRAAIKVRPSSYQAHHALAKNLMERAVDTVEECNGYAPYYMSEGEREIIDIIDNPAFSRGYIYSLHTYIDMKLKYLSKTDQKMCAEEIRYIVERLKLLVSKDIDSFIFKIINDFIEYAKNNGYEKEVLDLCCSKIVPSKLSCEEEYFIENLDL